MTALRMRHVTLDTGHVRESPRSEVSAEVVAQMQSYLRAALADPRGLIDLADVPTDPRASLHVTAEGGMLMVTVLAHVGRMVGERWIDAAPLVVLGIAPSETGARELWRVLHDCAAPKATRGIEPPPAPWCAVSLQIGLVMFPQASEWLGDLERCIAWAWMAEEAARQ